ncbi:MAG: DapH/DapD/GlmU-related protein [Proteobacteria bacterium]|nr:DapH/DapD/GlmU-related protein [Pseudomonadota bacterium]
MDSLFAFGLGVSTLNRAGKVIDTFFPAPLHQVTGAVASQIQDRFTAGSQQVSPASVQAFIDQVQPELRPLLEADRDLTAVFLPKDSDIGSTSEAFLKLHLLSHRLRLPNTMNLDGIFGHLPNIAWTSRGAIDLTELASLQLEARVRGEYFEVHSVDKFPKMANYVVPTGVRIADTSRIRLGAYLGEGTTVMPSGAINFNAAALGPNMVEGRISQGVILGADTDLGGGASTMGTLSGGGNITISIGKQCLIGANGGTGIPLGDRCTIEAGLYITAGTRVTVVDETGETVRVVKARELAGHSDLLFIRHGSNGAIQCRTNRKAIALNEQLHDHN